MSEEQSLTMFLVCAEAHERYRSLAIELGDKIENVEKEYLIKPSPDLAVQINKLKADRKKASTLRDQFQKKMSGVLKAKRRGEVW